MWLRKKTAGAASGGHVWEKDGDVIWVPTRLGLELVDRPGEEFEEADAPAGAKTPPEEAQEARAAQEVAEQAAMDARVGAESPSGTRLMDGRWAQTDTKGDEPVRTGLRDTGAEFAPANVDTAATTGVEDTHRTLTPGSSENKPVTVGPVEEDKPEKTDPPVQSSTKPTTPTTGVSVKQPEKK